MPKEPETEDVSQFYGHYINHTYGYAMDIPTGLVGTSASSIAPHHGISIEIPTRPQATIWVDGSYNATFLASLDEVADQQLEVISRDGVNVKVTHREITKLGALPAVRLTVQYSEKSSRQLMTQEIILALREAKGEVGIIYTVKLISASSVYQKTKRYFDKVVKSWQSRPLLET